jgi:hypothetical protein
LLKGKEKTSFFERYSKFVALICDCERFYGDKKVILKEGFVGLIRDIYLNKNNSEIFYCKLEFREEIESFRFLGSKIKPLEPGNEEIFLPFLKNNFWGTGLFHQNELLFLYYDFDEARI